MRKVTKILGMVLSTIILLSIFLPVSISLVLSLKSVQNYVVDKAAAFASEQGVDYVLKHTDPRKCTLWCAAVDEELTSKSYIVPGIGDAGDLAYGVKL